MATRKVIKHLTIGAPVTGVFRRSAINGGGALREPLVFTGLEGEGEDARATFYHAEEDYFFKVYRYNGRWAYGTSADSFGVEAREDAPVLTLA